MKFEQGKNYSMIGELKILRNSIQILLIIVLGLCACSCSFNKFLYHSYGNVGSNKTLENPNHNKPSIIELEKLLSEYLETKDNATSSCDSNLVSSLGITETLNLDSSVSKKATRKKLRRALKEYRLIVLKKEEPQDEKSDRKFELFGIASLISLALGLTLILSGLFLSGLLFLLGSTFILSAWYLSIMGLGKIIHYKDTYKFKAITYVAFGLNLLWVLAVLIFYILIVTSI